MTEGGSKLSSPKLRGFWDSTLEAVPKEGPAVTLWKREPIPEENLKNWCAFDLRRPAFQHSLPALTTKRHLPSHLDSSSSRTLLLEYGLPFGMSNAASDGGRGA